MSRQVILLLLRNKCIFFISLEMLCFWRLVLLRFIVFMKRSRLKQRIILVRPITIILLIILLLLIIPSTIKIVNNSQEKLSKNFFEIIESSKEEELEEVDTLEIEKIKSFSPSRQLRRRIFYCFT